MIVHLQDLMYRSSSYTKTSSPHRAREVHNVVHTQHLGGPGDVLAHIEPAHILHERSSFKS